ncbi:hypothetical protein ACX80U_13260 [Arthrobacter sp. TmT3-37]
MKVTVTVDDEHRPSIHHVAEQLGLRGMVVDRVLPGLGMITGSVTAALLAGLGTIDGVAAVDEELTYRLPSPGDAVQ